MECKYNRIHKLLNGYYDKDHCPQTNSIASMDNMHDAIIYLGVNLEKEEKHYVIKAKQFGINKKNEDKRHRELLRKYFYSKIDNIYDEKFNIEDYGLSKDEIVLCNELLQDKKANESCISRRYREKLVESIKSKLALYFHIKYYMGVKC